MDAQSGQTQPILIEPEEFQARLAEEIARSDRYEHAFTILVLRPPKGHDEPPPPASWLESLATSLVRGCDVVSIFDSEGVIAVLLPETGVAGGSAVLERFRVAIGDADRDWEARLLEYPANREAIVDLTEQAA